MKLRSHGERSDLLGHLQEVCLAATCLEEKIICACHDIGKATCQWQAYANGGFCGTSPHNHAATGGLLASLLIRLLNGDDAKTWAVVALHVGTAHHSYLGLSSHNKDEYCTIAGDIQAKEFFMDTKNGIHSLLPEVSGEFFQKAWEMYCTIAPLPLKAVAEFNQWVSLAEYDRLRAFLVARSILGRLCYQDHQSAAKQSGNSHLVNSWKNAFPEKVFIPRTPKVFPQSDKEIHRLRNELKRHFHQCLTTDSTFYFIDAPTGLGKTETMLSGAEILLKAGQYRRVIFSVPQVSIADQIYEEYFLDDDDKQIWNYIRQEKGLTETTGKTAEATNYDTPEFILETALQPFSQSYNVTTFNQVLLAMCHPLRTRCIRGIGLRDAIIIMDEFHKLPMTILPYFFRIARQYADLYNCKFIFGSATPLEAFDYLGLEDSIHMPRESTRPVYIAPAVNNRRLYSYLGALNINDVDERVQTFHDESDKSLLVVLNLVSQGTWPLLQSLHGKYDPWKQIEFLKSDDNSRAIVFLDGLVPPMLRREIVISCKEAMKRKPVTLITTQMVEVGVDLDFDHAFIDFQGLAATVQRGGRVGREGRDEPCSVEVFSLITTKDESSFNVLIKVQQKNDLRMAETGPFVGIAEKVTAFWRKENRFVNKWKDDVLSDLDLIDRLLSIQNKVFSKASSTELFQQFFSKAAGAGELGYNYLVAQHIAELFSSDYGTELLILKDVYERESLEWLVGKMESGNANDEERKQLNRFIVDHKIRVSNKSILESMGLNDAGVIGFLNDLKCMMAAPAIF